MERILQPGTGENLYTAKYTYDLSICPAEVVLGVPREPTARSGNELVLYPNPATTSLTITCNYTMNMVTICNVIGKTVYTQHTNETNTQIDIAGFPPGVYFVRVTSTGYGDEVKKFVKQ